MRRLAFVLVAAFVASAANASSPWVDDKGRQMTMQMPGESQTVFLANGPDAAAAVALFKKACLDTGLARSAAGTIAQESGWGFAYQPVMVPFKEPADIGGWYAADAALNVGSNLFFNQHKQYNLIAAPVRQPSLEVTQEAMSAAIGAPPVNLSEAFDKKGIAKKYFTPEWSVAIDQGPPARVSIMPVADVTGSYQLTVLQKANK